MHIFSHFFRVNSEIFYMLKHKYFQKFYTYPLWYMLLEIERISDVPASIPGFSSPHLRGQRGNILIKHTIESGPQKSTVGQVNNNKNAPSHKAKKPADTFTRQTLSFLFSLSITSKASVFLSRGTNFLIQARRLNPGIPGHVWQHRAKYRRHCV